MTCSDVRAYLDVFLDKGKRASFDVDAISAHASSCPECGQRLAAFFHVLELPESAFLRETLDELAIAMHGLALAVIRERHEPDANTDNLVPVDAPVGAAGDLARQGNEMVDDAEDWVGSTEVAGHDMGQFRDVLDSATATRERKLDVAARICESVSRLATRHLPRSLNLLGAVRLWKSDLDGAEEAFLRSLACRDPDEDGRRAQMFAHVNLGYVHRQRGQFDKAVAAARRAAILSEELGEDPLFGWFAQFCFEIERPDGTGLKAAEGVFRKLMALPDGYRRVCQALALENNRPVVESLKSTGFAAAHPDLIPPAD